MRRELRAALAMLVLTGCRTLVSPEALGRSLPYQRAVQTPEGRFQLDLPTPTPSVEAMMVSALYRAGPALARWGKLERPVTLFVLPDHRTLDAVIPAHLDALRAWAEADHVYFQSPSTWGPAGANERQVTDTLTHELTHTLMFQLAGADTAERQRQFPLWFREGMALDTAQQGDTVPTLESLAEYLLAHPDRDPLRDPGRAYDDPTAFDMAYGAGLHAFRFLIERYGATSVRTLLNAMRAGADFTPAFTASVGISPDAFVRDFETYVRLRGFAQGRPHHLPSRPPF